MIKKGTLHMRIGPMFAKKTTWLNTELTQFTDVGFKCLKIVHQLDDKRSKKNDCYGTTHNSSFKQLTSKIDVIKTNCLNNINIDNYHVIGIDEAQFFPQLYDVVYEWVEHKGIHVRVAGLCGDYKKQKFGQIFDLISLADEVIKLNAICYYCLEELKNNDFKGDLNYNAPFTKRIINNDEQIIIGDKNIYMPVCRKHHS